VSRIWDLLRASDSEASCPGLDPTLDTISVETVQIPASSRIVVHTDPGGPYADRFRLLRLRLQECRNADRKLKTLLITSPLAHEGKSTVALNLATALAERGKRPVLLVGADLHHATLAEQLGLSDGRGLAECLEEGLDPFSIIRRLEPLGWYLLPAGRARGNPSELLQSGVLAERMQELAKHFEWVLIDSPPVCPLADALTLKQRSDASLLVARAGRTPTEAVEQAVTLLGRHHLVGIVLNGMERFDSGYAKYYGSYRVEPS
jgi:capsular exopolysaccharide synthesis family protein